jgi:hypothetical protein
LGQWDAVILAWFWGSVERRRCVAWLKTTQSAPAADVRNPPEVVGWPSGGRQGRHRRLAGRILGFPSDDRGPAQSSARDVWAVGTRLTDQTLGKRLGSSFLHFDGNAWTETAPAGMWMTDNFIRVAGSGPADVWAVGEKGVIAHWNGQAWQPSASGTTVNLTDVWADSSASAWVVGGSGTILHWTPSQGWKPEPPITSVGLRAIWGRGPGEVWAAGPAGTILRFDGSAWHHQWAGTGGSFYNLRGDADVIHAVGEETNTYRLPHK